MLTIADWRAGAVAAAAMLAAGQLAPPVLTNSAGEPLPFANAAEVVDYLRAAEISDVQELAEGTTRPLRVTLRHQGLEVFGIFRSVDERHRAARWASQRGEIFFRDRAVFEVAAYELSQLLGVRHVPPAVERTWQRRTGSLQLWLDDAFTEGTRIREGRFDPATARWNGQLALMNAFDALIGNIDRNRGNLLIDSRWRLWFIDHTRAFSGSAHLELEKLHAIEQTFWQALRSTSDAEITAAVERHLTSRELRALLERRRGIVAHFEQLIAKRGESEVVYGF